MQLQIPIEKFACPCCGRNEMDAIFLDKLATIQFGMARELAINSGFRCPKHNAAIGGSPTSKHMLGLAADIACITAEDHYMLTMLAVRNGIRGFGIAKNFIHLDLRPDRCILWTYPIIGDK